jgi:predicted phage terminase large subunit-like protein
MSDNSVLFSLPRKKELANKYRGGRDELKKRIVSIEKKGKEKCRCIKVDNSNGLYITDDFIVTHNSDALLMASLQFVDTPGYNALLIRDTYKNLSAPESLMSRSHEWLHDTDAHWNGDQKVWTFPSGATLSFGYLDGPRDHLNYKSAAYQFVGIDEVVSIRENQALFLFSRMRKLKSLGGIPIRFRCASNPPTREEVERGEWVKKRYVDPNTREDRIFIPAWMSDNPYVDQEEYRKALSQLDPVTRRQLEEGDWDIEAAGFMFNQEDFEIVKTVPSDVVSVRYWDRAATERKKTVTEDNQPAATAGCKMSLSKDKKIYIEDIVRFQKNPLANEKIIKQTAVLDGIGTKIFMEQEPGSSGVDTISTYTRLLLGFSFKGDRPSGSKITRAEPLSAQVAAGNVFLVAGKWIPDFLREATLFPSGKYKDQIDAAAGAFNKLAFNVGGVRVRRV